MNTRPARPLNYGFAVMKVLMCFEVVLCHFWNMEHVTGVLRPFQEISSSAVPVFALISFYLTAPAFRSVRPQRVRRRMLRLCYPHAAWALIYWLVYLVLGAVHGVGELFWQVFTGHSAVLNPTMWFQTDLILVSALFFGMGSLVKGRKMLIAAAAAGLAALLAQYSGLNHFLFSGMRYELRYPLGRFTEMLPYASLSLILADQNILERLKKHPARTLVCSCALLALSFTGIIPTPEGFNYPGLNLMLRACGLIALAQLIPFDRAPAAVRRAVEQAGKYTLGIYCIHRLTEKLMNVTGLSGVLRWVGIPGDSFGMCIIIYLLSYLLAALIARAPGKWCRQLVE